MKNKSESYITMPELSKIVNESDLASIKNVASGILKIVNDIHSTPKDLENIIKLDPPLMVKVLKVTNSAYYSPPNKIDSIDQAIPWIGYDMLKYIALGQKVRDIFNQNKMTNGFSRTALWKHSIAVGLLSKLIYNKKIGEGGDNLYTAGLIHDIGLIAIEQFLPEEFNLILEQAGDGNIDQAEKTILGFTHAELAEEVTNHWKFPGELLTAIRYHHAPIQPDHEHKMAIAILYLADCLCIADEIGYSDAPQRDETVFQKCIDLIELPPSEIDSLMDQLRKEMAEVKEQGIL